MQQGLHGGRLADDVCRFGWRGQRFGTLFKGLLLFFQHLYFVSAETQLQGGGHGGQQFVVLPGLGDEVRGSLLDSLHRLLRVAVGGDEDDHRLWVEFQYLLQPGKAFASADGVAAEVHVQQDDVVPDA